jgi:hypothetical protein
MPSTFINQPIRPSDRTARVTEAGIEAELPALRITFPNSTDCGRGFMRQETPDGISATFGFLWLDDADDEGNPGWLLGSAIPLHLRDTDKSYTLYLMLPEDNPGMIVDSKGFTVVLEEEIGSDAEPAVSTSQPKSVVQDALREWKMMQRTNSTAVHGIVLDPFATGPRGSASYCVSAALVETDWNLTPAQRAITPSALALRRAKWTIS